MEASSADPGLGSVELGGDLRLCGREKLEGSKAPFIGSDWVLCTGSGGTSGIE